MSPAEKAALKRAWNHLDDAIQSLYEARIENRGGIAPHKWAMQLALGALGVLAKAEGVKLV